MEQINPRRRRTSARLAILREKATTFQMALREDLLAYLAQHVRTNVAVQRNIVATAFDFDRATERFYRSSQFGWQEYSELTNSELLISSAPNAGASGQLGISRNSEYRTSIPLVRD